MRLSRVLLWGLVLTVVGTAIAVAIAVFFFPMIRTELVLTTGIVLFVHLVGAIGCAVARERGRAPRLMLSGVFVAIGTAGAWIVLLWIQPVRNEEIWGRVLVWPSSWAWLMMLCGLLLLPEARQIWWLWLRRVAFILLVLLALHACLAITFHPDAGSSVMSRSEVRRYEETAARLAGVLGLLAGVAIVATLVSVWMMYLIGRVPPPLRTYQFSFVCPRCECEQDADTGQHQCAECGLALKVTVA
jgi:hypothetical protein